MVSCLQTVAAAKEKEIFACTAKTIISSSHPINKKKFTAFGFYFVRPDLKNQAAKIEEIIKTNRLALVKTDEKSLKLLIHASWEPLVTKHEVTEIMAGIYEIDDKKLGIVEDDVSIVYLTNLEYNALADRIRKIVK